MPDNPTCATCMWWGPRLARLPIVDLEETYSMRADVGSCRKALPSMNPSGWALWPNVANDDWCGEHAPRVEAPRCRMHPNRITGGALFCGYSLCGDCWTEEIIAERDGALVDFKKKILNGPESPDASV